MICRTCETENPENAKFCKNCGCQLSGEITCTACGQANPVDALFCTECGKRLTGNHTCSNCHTVHDGAFCPNCGTPSAQTVTQPQDVTSAKFDWKRIVTLCGGIAAILAVLFGLIFTFCIGVELKTSSGFGQTVPFLALSRSSGNLFYFFGKGYKEAAEHLDTVSKYGYLYPVGVYLPLVFGTVISAGILIAVPVLSIFAAVRLGKFLRGTSQKDYAAPAIGAFLTLALGAAALLGLHQMSVEALSISEGYRVSLKSYFVLNKATVAGLVLGGIFLAIFIGCRIASLGKALLKPSVIIGIGSSLLAAVFLFIALSFTSKAAVEFSHGDVSIKISFAQLISTFCPQTLWDTTATELQELYISGLTVVIIGEVFQLILLALIVATLVCALIGTFNEKKPVGLVLPIIVFVFAIGHLVLSILAGGHVQDVYGIRNELEFSYTAPIVAVVFATLTLLIAIARKVISRVIFPTK